MARKNEQPDPDATHLCYARWIDETGFICSCSNLSEPGKGRCRWHVPDGSRLDRDGKPVEVQP